MGDMIDIHGRTLCIDCANQFIAQGGSSAGAKRHVDPTICGNCGADGGNTPHGELCRVPTCQKCIDFYRNRPFPGWVKGFFAAVMILVVVSLVWNWRFFQAYYEIKAAWTAFGQGKADAAAEEMSSAAKHLPEIKETATTADFMRGIAFMQKDRCQEAEACFMRCRAMPPGYHVAELLQEASLGAAFDRKDYDKFLELAEQIEKQQPQSANVVAQVASAYACHYAIHGDQISRKTAEAKLEEAKKLNDKQLQADNYEERIRYRLESREIINREEFVKRFPNGWKPSGKSKT